MASLEPSESGIQTSKYTIVQVRSQKDLQDTINLFYQYAGFLGFSLAFQNFDTEMSAMPGKYAPPSGELLLARDLSGRPMGCVGLRPLSQECCEMKRLYVLPAAQGLGLGKTLATSIISKAVELGYIEMRLDTLPRMTAAIKMYASLGFEDIPAYYNTPMEGTRFLSLDLLRERKPKQQG